MQLQLNIYVDDEVFSDASRTILNMIISFTGINKNEKKTKRKITVLLNCDFVSISNVQNGKNMPKTTVVAAGCVFLCLFVEIYTVFGENQLVLDASHVFHCM